MSIPSERHARASDLHVRRWRRLTDAKCHQAFDDTATLCDALIDTLSLTNGRRILQLALDSNTPFTEHSFDVKDGGDRVSVRHVAR